MKRTYVPTEADRATGDRLRTLRNRRGETLKQTAEFFGKDASTLAATERGERQLTEIEAAKLASHFGVAVSQVIVDPALPAPAAPNVPGIIPEQVWLGNEDEAKPALFAVPDQADFERRVAVAEDDLVVIRRSDPMTPEQYRLEVWLPYLEARYAADQQKTA